MYFVFGSKENANLSKLGEDKTDLIVEFHVQATKSRHHDSLVTALEQGTGDLLGVLNTSRVHSLERYKTHLASMGDSDYVWDDRALLIFDDILRIADEVGVDVKIAACDYNDGDLGRNALKLRNNVVKLQEGGVLDINKKKAPKPTKKAAKADKGEGIE